MNQNNTARGFIPEIWDATIYRTLEDNLVLNKIAKAPLEKSASQPGDTIYFADMGDPTISDYTGSLTPEDIKDSQLSMTIDKTKTFCFAVKDLDSLMANADLSGSQTQRAAYNLKDAIEKDFMQNVGADANAGTALSATITSANVISNVGELARQLYEQNVTDSNLWIVLPHWMKLKLELAGIKFQINNGVNGKGGMFWTNELGYDVYVTNTVYNAGNQATPISTVMAGSYQAIGYTDIMLKTRTIPLSGSRKTQVDGGAAYGYKLVLPKQLAKGTFTFGAETTI